MLVISNDNREYAIERPDVPVSWTIIRVRGSVHGFCQRGGWFLLPQRRAPADHAFRANGVPLTGLLRVLYRKGREPGEYWSVSGAAGGKDLRSPIRVP